jgi:hypothetical protein
VIRGRGLYARVFRVCNTLDPRLTDKEQAARSGTPDEQTKTAFIQRRLLTTRLLNRFLHTESSGFVKNRECIISMQQSSLVCPNLSSIKGG